MWENGEIPGNGPAFSPFADLFTALVSAWQDYTIIGIVGNEAVLTRNSGKSGENPLKNTRVKEMSIKSSTCSVAVHPGCVENWAILSVFDPVSIGTTNGMSIFIENLVITGKKVFFPLEIWYCPAVFYKGNAVFDDRNQLATENATKAANLCGRFSNFSLFSIESQGILTLKVSF